jgi:hypothetical protein
MPMDMVKDILSKDVENGALDENVVRLLFEMIETGEIDKIFE